MLRMAGAAAVAEAGSALGVVSITILVSLLVTRLGERSLSGILVDTILLVGVWQPWRSEPASEYPR